MKDNVLFISVWAAYASLRPHIIKEGSCAEAVLESRATYGLCYLSLLNKTGKNFQNGFSGGCGKRSVSHNLEDLLRKKRFSQFCLKVQ